MSAACAAALSATAAVVAKSNCFITVPLQSPLIALKHDPKAAQSLLQPGHTGKQSTVDRSGTMSDPPLARLPAGGAAFANGDAMIGTNALLATMSPLHR